MRGAFLQLLVFVIAHSLNAQPVLFEKITGGPEAEILRSVRELQDGMLMAAGIRANGPLGGSDFAFLRFQPDGELVWTKFYGTAYDDNCLSMATCSDGNLVLAGETFTSDSLLNGFVIKVDSSGNEIWRKSIGTEVNESIRFITETSDKGFICAGYQNDVNGSNDSWFLRLDSIGNIVWTQTYGGWSTEYADMIRELPDGRFIATGDTKSMGNGGYDVEVFLLDEAGIPEFDLTFGDQFQNGCQGIIVLADGSFLSFGETEVYANSPYEMFLEKIDTAGNSVWRRTFGGNGADAAFSVSEMADGSFMITGYTTSVGGGPLNVAVAKADPNGYLKWIRAYGSPGIDIGYDLQPSRSGGFLIAGRTAPGDDQYYLLHVSEEGLLNTVPERMENKPLIYPNPVVNELHISSADPIRRIVFTDMKGVVIKEIKTSDTHFLLTFNDVPAGLYHVTCETDKEVFGQRVVVCQ